MIEFFVTFFFSFFVVFAVYGDPENKDGAAVVNLIGFFTALTTLSFLEEFVFGKKENVDFLIIGLAIIFSFVVNLIIKYYREEEIKKQKWEAERPHREKIQREYKVRRDNERREQENEEKQKKAIEKAKKNVEMVAMNVSISFEIENKRTPADVSSKNLGYDIKSSSPKETRFIEVKGKSESGDIEVTINEWDNAKELENNYFLYVVFNCASTSPILYVIQNPTAALKHDLNRSGDKYIIPSYEITKHDYN